MKDSVGKAFIKGQFPGNEECLKCPVVKYCIGLIDIHHKEILTAIKGWDKAVQKRLNTIRVIKSIKKIDKVLRALLKEIK